MNVEELNEEITRLGLSQFREEILSVAQPCFSVKTTAIGDSQDVDASQSKIGGCVGLPVGSEWPTDTNGEPLLFLAKFTGTDLAPLTPQLEDRQLLFFCGPEFNEGRILNLPLSESLISVDCPYQDPGVWPWIKQCGVTLSPAISLPDDADEFDSWRYSIELKEFGATEREVWEGVYVTDSPLKELISSQYGSFSAGVPCVHRLFGYPVYIQGHPSALAEQRVTSHYGNSGENEEEFQRRASQRWRSILSLMSDDGAEFLTGETSGCVFMVTESDLNAGILDSVAFSFEVC